ncbi:MAG: AraC family transcriptional regulator [Marinobacter sp.]|uniref:AraC family transcriptional regulator n=1 Tax=Marinobacter sp. TaxID=50741 RepID=UPI00299D3A6A|nr:AraC family transcriptional regulator [Marinobacter sp.]MDX1755529.1 AraC family transcriptional regulator [Marinobacter sp.]
MITDNNPGSLQDGGDHSGGMVLAGLIQHLLIVAEKHGVSRDSLLAEMKARPEELADPNQLIPARYLERLMTAGLAFTQDELLGLHLSQYSRPEGFGVAGYILQACSSVREIIEMCIRYEHLVSSMGRTSLHYEPGMALWAWDISTDNDLFRWQAVDFLMGSLTAIARMLPSAPADGFLSHVQIRHPPPDSASQVEEYQRIFGCPVRFNQKLNALVIPLDGLNVPLVNSNAAMREALETHARFLERKNDCVDFVERARSKLRVLMGEGSASRGHLADSLEMSGRTLLRRLSEKGTTYREMVDGLRLEMAEKLLAEGGDSVESIAHRLQYTESHSFIRWFKSRKGLTPARFREKTRNPNNERGF